MEPFVSDHSRCVVVGEPLTLPMPDTLRFGNEEGQDKISFGYLMLFTDGNRIDLTLFPIDKFKNHFKRDSLTNVLLDKNDLFNGIGKPGISDYLVKRPTQKEFSDYCNEFWWVSTYV